MGVLIPIVREADGPAWIEQQAVLDGATYTLIILWNERYQAWYLQVFDAEGVTPLRNGIKLVADYQLVKWTVSRTPTGFFYCIDTATPVGRGEDPGFDDLGTRHQLHYFPLSDFPTTHG